VGIGEGDLTMNINNGQIISTLKKVIKLHTVKWRSLKIKKYDQIICPPEHNPYFGECGCASHTIAVWDRKYPKKTIPVLIPDNENQYLFGFPSQIKLAAKALRFPIPERFERRDFVFRAKRVIKHLQKDLNL